jgi:hypothetical protein
VGLSLNRIDDYEFNREKPLIIGICTQKWWKVLKNVSQEHTVEILMTEQDMIDCTVQLSLIDNNDVAHYTLSQMNLEYVPQEIPDQVFESTISLPAMKFQKNLRYCIAACGDAEGQIRISSNIVKMPEQMKDGTIPDPNKLVNVPELIMEAHDESSGSVEPSVCVSIIINGCFNEKGERIEFSENSFCHKQEWFSLRRMVEISKSAAMNPTGSVIIYLSPNYPIVLSYEVGTLGTLKYALAPKISDEDIDAMSLSYDAGASAKKTITMTINANEQQSGSGIADDGDGDDSADVDADGDGGQGCDNDLYGGGDDYDGCDDYN